MTDEPKEQPKHGDKLFPRIDRLPPHSHEAEQGVLGCCLMGGSATVDEAFQKLSEDDFYDIRHRLIWGALVDLWRQSVAVDMLSVVQRLHDNLAAVGGIAYLNVLLDSVPSAANLPYYSGIVIERSIKRRFIIAMTSLVGELYESGDMSPAQVVDLCESKLFGIGQSVKRKEIEPIRETVKRVINQIEEMHERKGLLIGVSSGIIDLDKLTGGFRDGDLIIIAGRPSIGKSALGAQIAEQVAVEHKSPVLYHSLEMSNDSLVLRAICSRGRVNIRDIREGFLVERDFPKLTNAAHKISHSELWIDDSSGLSALEIRTRARRMIQRHKIKLIVIDYLQLLNGNGAGRRFTNRQEEVAWISGALKSMARELNVPVIVLAQLNRGTEKENRRPRLSDLRESGAIECDADVIGLLYKLEREDGEHDDQDATPVNLYIAKQRNGPTGEVPLTFLKGYTRFENASKVVVDDVPQDNRYPD